MIAEMPILDAVTILVGKPARQCGAPKLRQSNRKHPARSRVARRGQTVANIAPPSTPKTSTHDEALKTFSVQRHSTQIGAGMPLATDEPIHHDDLAQLTAQIKTLTTEN